MRLVQVNGLFMKNYKIMYHFGKTIGLKDKVDEGIMVLKNDQIWIKGKENLSIPFAIITSAEGYRLHGLGQMVKITYDEKVLYVSVVRFCLFGCFAMVNLFATLEVLKNIKSKVNKGR